MGANLERQKYINGQSLKCFFLLLQTLFKLQFNPPNGCFSSHEISAKVAKSRLFREASAMPTTDDLVLCECYLH